MDLKRKLGLGSDSRQSYELIRSTQSLVDRLNLDTEDITIQPVHPSIMGQVGSLHVTNIFRYSLEKKINGVKLYLLGCLDI